jgi:hypothetical protein
MFKNHLPDLSFDIAGLVSDWDLGKAGQIDQGQSEDVGRVDTKVDGSGGDAGISSNLGFCLSRDLVSNLGEVVELLPRGMKELSPLIGIGLLIVGGINLLGLDSIALGRAVDKLKNEGTSGYNTRASGQAERGGQSQGGLI